jgi:hypothetical protein
MNIKPLISTFVITAAISSFLTYFIIRKIDKPVYGTEGKVIELQAGATNHAVVIAGPTRTVVAISDDDNDGKTVLIDIEKDNRSSVFWKLFADGHVRRSFESRHPSHPDKVRIQIDADGDGTFEVDKFVDR